MGPREHRKQAFLAVSCRFWPLRARNGQKRPETACRRSVTARLPRPCLGAVGYQLTLHGSLKKRRNESKLLDQQPANSYDGRWQMASTAGRSIHADRSIDSLRKIHRKLTQNADWPDTADTPMRLLSSMIRKEVRFVVLKLRFTSCFLSRVSFLDFYPL